MSETLEVDGLFEVVDTVSVAFEPVQGADEYRVHKLSNALRGLVKKLLLVQSARGRAARRAAEMKAGVASPTRTPSCSTALA